MEDPSTSADFPPSDSNSIPSNTPADPPPTWAYPTRICRICLEDVVPTVSFYPPGLPPAFQRPVVEYKNDDEYGRLIKPCKCRGGMRYIHELCLKRSRTDSVRPGSLWKCHQCGYQFNFQRLTLQRYLGSTTVSAAVTALVMLMIIFILGFIADPIINLYVDPYDTLTGNEDFWSAVDIQNANEGISGWSLHFMKGLVSMGLVGFLKTALLNPFQWWNLRGTGWISARSSGTSATGRDRAASISWIAVVIGISSAFYFFYQWVQTIIGKTLQRIGNNIVDTQLPGDDEDLKPPPGWKFPVPEPPQTKPAGPVDGDSAKDDPAADTTNDVFADALSSQSVPDNSSASTHPLPSHDQPNVASPEQVLLEDQFRGPGAAYSSALEGAREQEWSFVDL